MLFTNYRLKKCVECYIYVRHKMVVNTDFNVRFYEPINYIEGLLEIIESLINLSDLLS